MSQTWGKTWKDSLTGIAEARDFILTPIETQILWTTSSMTRSLAASQRLQAAASWDEQFKASTGTPSCNVSVTVRVWQTNVTIALSPFPARTVFQADNGWCAKGPYRDTRSTKSSCQLNSSSTLQNQGTILTRSTNSSDVPLASS